MPVRCLVQDFTPFRSKGRTRRGAKGPDIQSPPLAHQSAQRAPASGQLPGPGRAHHPGRGRFRGEPRKGGARLGAAGRAGGPRALGLGRTPRLLSPTGRRGGAGRGARGGPGRSAGRSSSCGGGLVRAVLPLPGGSDPARAPPRTRTRTCTGSDAAPGAPLAGGGCATMADKEAGGGDPGSRGERAARGPAVRPGGPGREGVRSAGRSAAPSRAAGK